VTKRFLYDGGVGPDKRGSGNPGLWFDKFPNQWNDVESKNPFEKNPWINRLQEQHGEAQLLKEHSTRRFLLVQKQQGAFAVLQTEWAFVTGLGRSHPLENGFAWHHSLGAPFLPGSSIKGVVRSWANELAEIANAAAPTPEDIFRIFGPRGKDVDKCVGTVIFMDALPPKPVSVRADIMTPHHKEWYSAPKDRDAAPPTDWEAPIPIPFLAVAKEQSFAFACLPRKQSQICKDDCQLVMQWLEEALLELGAGAKTSSGYGRFVKNSPGRPTMTIDQAVEALQPPDPLSERAAVELGAELLKKKSASEDFSEELQALNKSKRPKAWQAQGQVGSSAVHLMSPSKLKDLLGILFPPSITDRESEEAASSSVNKFKGAELKAGWEAAFETAKIENWSSKDLRELLVYHKKAFGKKPKSRGKLLLQELNQLIDG